ncbi:hypothetical protein [Flavobacterium sp. UMI-01]|uniref:hypothetical protein n=1 Tax=Flavobacterium sp. UMI-01 TaxID=1441053 RepID=UPI001C7D3B6E|nr:hypothetical protein [Flavobacterium sp. UMI-01]GIZ07896.1 hypothetical protein FUMI01_06230 [Flavobacterium sp. UMI-01]
MKKIIILLSLFIAISSYAQSRYSQISTSTFNPEVPNPDYYKAMAEQKIETIKNNIYYYDNLTKKALKLDTDLKFKQDIYEIIEYINLLKETNSMSFNEVDSYLNLIDKKYNKAIKNYNKRVKN